MSDAKFIKEVVKKLNYLPDVEFIDKPLNLDFDMDVNAGIWVDVPMLDDGGVSSSVIKISGRGDIVCFAPREFNCLSSEKEVYAALSFPYQEFDKQFFSGNANICEPVLVRLGNSSFFVENSIRYVKFSVLKVSALDVELYKGLIHSLESRCNILSRLCKENS